MSPGEGGEGSNDPRGVAHLNIAARKKFSPPSIFFEIIETDQHNYKFCFNISMFEWQLEDAGFAKIVLNCLINI